MDVIKQFDHAEICFRQQHLSEAETLLKQILLVAPDYAQANHLLGLIAGQRGEYDLAGEYIKRAIRNNPGEVQYHFSLGHAMQGGGRLDEALVAYEQVIRLEPGFAEAHSNRGAVLCNLGRFDESLSAYDQAIRIKPEYAIAQTNRGHVLHYLGRMEEALAAHEQAVRIAPGYANAHYNRGVILADLGHHAESLAAYEEAISIDPDDEVMHKNYAMLLLLTGNYERGWKEYEWRLEDKELDPPRRSFNLPRWGGEPLDGNSILVYAEQGIGDEIMFASCITDIASKAETVMVDCDERLEPLLKRSFPSITTHGGKQTDPVNWINLLPEPDYQIEIGSLPRFFRNDINKFPEHDGYLKADPSLARKWRKRLDEIGNSRKVGVSWRGGNIQERIIERSIPLEQWEPIAECPDLELINLQYDYNKDEIARAESTFSKKIHSWGDINPLFDLEEFAALITELDLVITIDNSTAHMSGALGVPVWILLPLNPDWRWLLERDDTPWYPSARLFRQPKRGDYKSVISKIGTALKE